MNKQKAKILMLIEGEKTLPDSAEPAGLNAQAEKEERT